jgi:hypothetical protein
MVWRERLGKTWRGWGNWNDLKSLFELLGWWPYVVGAASTIMTIFGTAIDRTWSPASVIVAGIVVGLLCAIAFSAIAIAIQSYRMGRTNESPSLVAAIPYDQWKDLDEIDLETGAAIWAGTRDPANVTRHLRFRALKQAVRRDELRAHKKVGGKVNRVTTVRPAALAAYFASGTAKADLEDSDQKQVITRPTDNPKGDQTTNRAFICFRPGGFIVESQNVSSITNSGTGDFTITFATDFDSDNIACLPVGTTPRDFYVASISRSAVNVVFSGNEPEEVALSFEGGKYG